MLFCAKRYLNSYDTVSSKKRKELMMEIDQLLDNAVAEEASDIYI